MKKIEFHAMGSRMLAAIDSNTAAAEHAIEQVPGWFEEWEQILSRFREDSELSRLNRSDGHPFVVSPILWEVFHASREMETWTRGLVRPTVLDALLQAGYDRSFEMIPDFGISGADLMLDELTLPSLATAIGWDAATHSLELPPAVHLDFGGLAKGWCAQRALERLAVCAPALVDAGGDISVSGPGMDGSPWPVGIRDPFQTEKDFDILMLGHCGVATSGTDYHRWQQNGQVRHHIIDPRSGLPADTDILTATIIGPDTVHAEAAAKTVLILGTGYGLDWLEADPSLAGALVLQNGEVIYSQRMGSFLWK
jgi:thiamine biosynthesis lipoprotein